MNSDLDLARANREAGIEKATQGADPEWMEAAVRAVRWVARWNRTFTSDDVWDAIKLHRPDVSTPEHRAMGSVFRRAVANGWAELAGCAHCGTKKVMVSSRRPQANAMDTPVYVSLIHRG